MIQVTHLDGEPFLLNAEWIRYVESRPDTFITLVQGERIVVRESPAEVLERCLEYQRSKLLLPAASVRRSTNSTPHDRLPQPS